MCEVDAASESCQNSTSDLFGLDDEIDDRVTTFGMLTDLKSVSA